MSETFPRRVQALRSRRGLTRTALAGLIGVSRPTLWAWETGKGQPRDRNVEALAEALAVSAEFLKYGASLAAGEYDEAGGEDSLQLSVAQAKARIAKLAGVDESKVTILIEY